MSEQAVIEVWGLRKEFGEVAAIRDLTLRVGAGEIFGFLGPNGAGKTTAMKMLLGLVHPTAGGGRVLSAPLGDRATRARIGFLPEHCRFHEWLTGRELLAYHAELAGVDARLARDHLPWLLTRLELGGFADRPVRTYSKGMAQRVGLAVALLGLPQLVFLDEPTSGLDPLGRLLVRDLIRELKAQGTTVFLNSHLLGEVEVTCDRVAFLRSGAIARELNLAGPNGGIEVELRLDRNGSEILQGLSRFGRDVRTENGTIRLRIDSEEMLPVMSRWLVGAGRAGIYHLATHRPSLEREFIEVMKGGEDQR